MFNNISYNVVVERFKAFADGHFLIRRFTHGQVDQTDLDKDQLFPWMHVAPVEVRAATGARVFTFDVIFADIPRDKEDKTDYQKESISDCIRLAEDLLSEIQNGQVVFSSLVEVEGESTITPFIEEWTHTLSGCTLALTISVPNDYSACDIPADWSIGGGGGGGTPPSPFPSLILQVNNEDNVVQNVLDLVDGDNITIEDLGDGRVRINSTGGGGGTSTLISTEFNQNHVSATGNPYLVNDVVWYGGSLYRCIAQNDAILPSNSSYWTLVGSAFRARQTPVDWNATSGDYQILNKPTLATVATTGDYDDLDNLPSIPSIDGLVPYTGATQNVDLGEHKLKTESATDFTEIAPSYVTARNADSTKYSQIEKTGVTVVDDAAGDTMNMNAGGLTFPDASSQYTAAVNADWNATSGLAEILNKPTFPPVIGDMLKSVYDTDDDGIVDFAEALKTEVRNSTGATLHKGHIVRLSGSTGNRPNAVYAQANNDANSAQTFGVVKADIANNSNGYVITLGQIADLDTRSTATNPFTSNTLADGDVIYLSPTTPGHITNIKPSAPQHIVYVGMVVRTSPTNGTIQYRIQNGYELNEIHDVVATAPVDNDYLYYEASTDLYKLRQMTAARITDANTVGQSLVKLANPNVISYMRINADNTVATLTLAQLKAELGLIAQIQATQLTNSSTTVGVDITGCTVALEANAVYIGKMTIASGSVPVLGFSMTFTFPSGTTVSAGRINSGASTTGQVMQWSAVTSGTALSPLFGTAQNQAGYAEIQFYISVGSTAGNFVPSFRSGSTGSAITIYAGLTSIQLQKV
jgi:hypothetical protein